jgi:hypothetical protein
VIAFSQTTAASVTAWATLCLLGAGLGAILFAYLQVRTTRNQAKLDRTVGLHVDATTGEVQAAKRRLGTLLWGKGESVACQRRVRYQPLFDEFFPTVEGVENVGVLAAYKPDITSDPTAIRPLTDLYCVLHSFERLYAARGAVEGLFDSLAWDTCSWSMVLERVREEDTTHVASLHKLANSAFWRLSCADRGRLRNLSFVDASDPTPRAGRTPWDESVKPTVPPLVPRMLSAAWREARHPSGADRAQGC